VTAPLPRALGWRAPTLAQQVRALRRAHPEAGDSVLAGIVPAPTSDLLPFTHELNQKSLGACTAHGIAQAVYVAEAINAEKTSIAPFILARLWLYYSERALEGTIGQDAGANIGDGFTMLASKGIPPESCYPYDVAKFAQDPGPSVDRLAYDSRGQIGLNYHPISTGGEALLTDVEKALTGGFAVVFGCQVSEAFCSTQPSGTVMAPGPTDQIAGGHCLCVIGHDRAGRRLKVKNSWGDSWSDPDAGPGCFFMDYSYFAHSMYGASDIWIVLAIPQGVAQ
jgi:C1A family cysteine protease